MFPLTLIVGSCAVVYLVELMSNALNGWFLRALSLIALLVVAYSLYLLLSVS